MTIKLSTEPVARKHQLKIARATLKMNDAMVGVMGGMTKTEAAELIKQSKVTR